MFQPSWQRAENLLKEGGVNLVRSLNFEEAREERREMQASSQRVLVTSDTVRDKRYLVELCQISGRALCACYQFRTNKDPACKHIVAAAFEKGMLDLLIQWLHKDKNQKPFGQGGTQTVGGWKKGSKPRKKTGMGFLQRNNLPTVTTGVQMGNTLDFKFSSHKL